MIHKDPSGRQFSEGERSAVVTAHVIGSALSFLDVHSPRHASDLSQLFHFIHSEELEPFGGRLFLIMSLFFII